MVTKNNDKKSENKKGKKTSYYFSKKPTSRLNVKKITPRLLGEVFVFETPSGVFSFGKPDRGSMLLIEKSTIPDKAKVLDLGCGYGLVGVSLAKVHDDLKITMTDINERAVAFAQKNLRLNRIKQERITFCKGNLYEPFLDEKGKVKEKFDVILSSPPMHAGKELCLKIIGEAPCFLVKGGTLQMVARHQKGGRPLMERMLEVFGNVETLVKSGGFRIYLSKKE